jgi:hypothetical protein
MDCFVSMATRKPQGIKAKELLAFLPLELLESTALQTEVDKNVKKLFGKDMFLLLLLSVLDSERVSLRVMQDLYSNHKFQLLAGVEENSKTRFTSISDRLMNIRVEYFEEIFKASYAHLSKQFPTSQIEKHSIVRFDSTSISASAKLLTMGMTNGMPNAKSKEHTIKQLKITIGFDGLFARSAKVFTEQKYLAEDLALGETISQYGASKDSIVVFDRGLKKRTTFAKFSEQSKLFVTRINPTQSYQVIKTNEDVPSIKSDSLEFICDEQVYLFHQDKRKLKVPFRLIQAKRKEDGQLLFFLTNIWDMNATVIADIYKSRWDIEVFFRFLKQELNLKHFASYSINGIRVVIYVLLIAAMLIMLYKKHNNIESYKRAKLKFIQAIETEITRMIVEICGGNPDATAYLNST